MTGERLSQKNLDAIFGSSKRSSKGRKDKVSFEEEAESKSGNYWHYKKKKKRFFYEDILKGRDKYFYLDVGTECDTYFRGQKVQYTSKKTEIFYHVVDLDSFEYHKVVFHTYLNSVLQSLWFRILILGLVILSAIMIGLTTFEGSSDAFDDVLPYFKIIDQIILSVFIFEIVVKWMYDFRLFWKVWWNILDFLIVLTIILTAVFPISGGGSRALVIVRVVRAFRSLKSISSLSSLTIVTHTVIKSGADMLNILIVLIIFMLVMAVMGVILFDTEALRGTNWFLNACNAWFVIFICVTQDGWNSVLDEFRAFPDYFGALATYLIFAVSIGAFVFANLIVAVIVANLELSVKEMREEQRLTADPLDSRKGFMSCELEIIPTYELFANDNLSLLSQRPMKIPTFRHMSLRRIQSYITSLEQNMLEAEIIQLDFEKVMAVILSIMLQLDVYSAPVSEKERKEGINTLNTLKRISKNFERTPKDAIDRIEKATQLQRLHSLRKSSNLNK